MTRLLRSWLRSLFRPRDPEMAQIDAAIIAARARHKPVRHLQARKTEIIHARLRAAIA